MPKEIIKEKTTYCYWKPREFFDHTGLNLTDEEYEQERFASDIIGMIMATPGNPRQYGVTVNYNF